VRTKSHDDRFGHSSNIKVVSSTFLEATVLVLLKRGIYGYEVGIKLASCGMIRIPSFMTIGSGIQAILRVLSLQFLRPQCWYYRLEGITMQSTETASGGMIHIPRFVTIR
jgi:hypothetical protein